MPAASASPSSAAAAVRSPRPTSTADCITRASAECGNASTASRADLAHPVEIPPPLEQLEEVGPPRLEVALPPYGLAIRLLGLVEAPHPDVRVAEMYQHAGGVGHPRQCRAVERLRLSGTALIAQGVRELDGCGKVAGRERQGAAERRFRVRQLTAGC